MTTPHQSNNPATEYEAWSGLEDDGDSNSVQLHYEHGFESTSRKKKLKQHQKNLYLHDSASDDSLEVYIVHQRYAYFSILFAVVQTGILLVMIIQCGVAPLYLNPMIGPYPDALSYWGGKNAVDILEMGEWWRLITPIFLHAGVIHLIGNVAVQLDTGAFFEREWGSRIWLAIYLSSAIGSSILSCIFMPNSISVGSSGAVMGLFGGKLAEVVCRFTEPCMTKQERIGHKVRQEQLGVVLGSVAIVMLFSFIPFVDWAAHLGGLIAGFFVGLVLFGCWIENTRWRIWWCATGAGITIILFTASLIYMYSGNIEVHEELADVCQYYQQFYEDYECSCQRN